MIALVGIQPRLRQAPPTLSFSIRATLAPSWAARIAATYPPGPPPITATSNLSDISLLVVGPHPEFYTQIGGNTCAFFFVDSGHVNDRGFDVGNVFLGLFNEFNNCRVGLLAIKRMEDLVVDFRAFGVQADRNKIDQTLQFRQDVPAPEKICQSVCVNSNINFLFVFLYLVFVFQCGGNSFDNKKPNCWFSISAENDLLIFRRLLSDR